MKHTKEAGLKLLECRQKINLKGEASLWAQTLYHSRGKTPPSFLSKQHEGNLNVNNTLIVEIFSFGMTR